MNLSPEAPGAVFSENVLEESGAPAPATINQAEAAFGATFRGGTRLDYAMPSPGRLSSRLTTALFIHKEICTWLIADSVCSYPWIVRLTWKCKGNCRHTRIKNNLAVQCKPAGSFFPENPITVFDEKSVRVSETNLADSGGSLGEELTNFVANCGVEAAEVLSRVALTSVDLLGLITKILHSGTNAGRR